MRTCIHTVAKIIRPIAIAGGIALATRHFLKRKPGKGLLGKLARPVEQFVSDDLAYHRWMS